MRTIVLRASLLFALNYVSPVNAQSAAAEGQLSYEGDEDSEGAGVLTYDPEDSEPELAQDVTGLEIMAAPHPPGAPAPSAGTSKKGRGCSVAPGVVSTHTLFAILGLSAALLLRRRAAGG